MSLWRRIANVFRGNRLNHEIDEELEAHIADAIEMGRDPQEARRAFGSSLRVREESRDARIFSLLDSLRADAVFGWRRLKKSKVTSTAAILSLAIAIGSCTSAFRLIDAMLVRPLPIANPERLYEAGSRGIDPTDVVSVSDSLPYPLFAQMRAIAKGQAELIAISNAIPVELTYGSADDTEKPYVQFVSGWMFSTFGLKPALGRVLTESDDVIPGAHPYAVISYDYWTRRFGNDPSVIGRGFVMGKVRYEIVGVAARGFSGTEPGKMTDIFIPTMMHQGVTHADWGWFRTFIELNPGVRTEPLQSEMDAAMKAFNAERAKGFTGMPKQSLENFLNQTFVMSPASSGASFLQEDFRRPLEILGVLVALVLLIACANVANLMAGQTAVRAREMALRVSIGAGRARLVQLVLMESAWLGLLAAAIGGFFAWRATPFVVGMINPPDNPARLVLPADWRVLGFGFVLAVSVTMLFGLAPALRASSVKPASALKGGENPRGRHRFMHAMILAQAAFCFVVVFVSGLLVTSFEHLSKRPTGFSSEGIINLDVAAKQAQPESSWNQVAEHLRAVAGVESVARAGWSLMSGSSSDGFISVNGMAPTPELVYFLKVSPGWAHVMNIPIVAGRDLRANDAAPGAALVNEAFVNIFFHNENPIGKIFDRPQDANAHFRFEIVGVVGNALYRNMREEMTPIAYVPLPTLDDKGAAVPRRFETFLVHTRISNPNVLAAVLRKEVTSARSEFHVTEMSTQEKINQAQTVRERLLATLAMFFAGVALTLAGIGLYGVLHYSVMQRRREIGIRIAVGAQARHIARLVTAEVFFMIVGGSAVGIALSFAAAKYIASLLYEVRGTSPVSLAAPAMTILTAVTLAALPAILQAMRIDPVEMLRPE